MTEKKSTKY